MMTNEELRQYNFIKLDDERILGKSEDIGRYLRNCLTESIWQNMLDNVEWTEAQPEIGSFYEDIKRVESAQRAELYTISECGMSPNGIIVNEFEEAK